GEPLVDRIRVRARLAEVGRRRLEPEHVGVRSVGERANHRRVEAFAYAEEALGRPFAGQELGVFRVDVRREQGRAEGVRSRDEYRVHAWDVGGEPRGRQRADELLGRNEDLAAEMAALLLRRELSLV